MRQDSTNVHVYVCVHENSLSYIFPIYLFSSVGVYSSNFHGLGSKMLYAWNETFIYTKTPRQQHITKNDNAKQTECEQLLC